MSYTNDFYSRLGDGWYAEKANSMETVVGQINIRPSVKIPQRSSSGQWNPSTSFKCDWADVTYNPSSTAGISGSALSFEEGDSATFTVKAILAGIEKWRKLSWESSGAGTYEVAVNGNVVTNGQDLSSFNFTSETLTVTITGLTGTFSILSVTPELSLIRSDENSILIEEDQVEGLSENLSIIDNNISSMNGRIDTRLKILQSPTPEGAVTIDILANANVAFPLSEFEPDHWVSFIPIIQGTAPDLKFILATPSMIGGIPTITFFNTSSVIVPTSFYVDWFITDSTN